MNRCEICYTYPVDRAHLVARSVLPKNEEWNPKYWIYLCRMHHSEQHTIGIITFCNKYGLMKQLKDAGFPEHKIDDWLKNRRKKCTS